MIKTLINTAHSTIAERSPVASFVFAHGAGAGQNSEFMQILAQGLAKQGINVIRFNFAYMQLAQELGKRRPPDRADKLLVQFNTVLREIDQSLPIFIGGKSMGGRMASMLLAQSNALACICMGYPFHPPAKPEKLRTEHLLAIDKPVLILQGERDTFGTREEIRSFNLSPQVKVSYLNDGDHNFKPRKKSGSTEEKNLNQAIERSAAFMKAHL